MAKIFDEQRAAIIAAEVAEDNNPHFFWKR